MDAAEITGDNVLHFMARRHRLPRGAEVTLDLLNALNYQGETPLITAVKERSSTAVRQLVRFGANLNYRDPQGNTALHWAMKEEDTYMISLLVRSGANSTILNNKGESSLHIAAALGDPKIVRLVIKESAIARASVDVPNGKGNTPLHIAVKNQKARTATALVKDRASRITTDAKGNTALHCAVQVENPYIARAVIHPMAIHHRNDDGDTPLMIATKKGAGAVFHVALLKLEQLEVTDPQGNTLIHLACLPQNGTILTHLIKQRLFQQIDPRNSQGATPLHFACQQNNITAVRNLVLYSANVNTCDKQGQTPLMAAIIVRNNEMCEFLIRNPLYGATCSINAQNNLGNSALHLCALTNNTTIGRLLIEQGANPALQNNNGQTAALIILGNSVHRLPEYGQILARLEEAETNSDNSHVEEL